MDKFCKCSAAMFLSFAICFFVEGMIMLSPLRDKSHIVNVEETVLNSNDGESGKAEEIKNDIFIKSMKPAEPDELENVHKVELDKISEQYGAVGVSAAVIINGKVAYHYEYGYADKEAEKPMTKDTKVRVASISKTALTMALMTLSDDDKISLDETMGEIFGENTTYGDVTIRALLAHASGINDDEAKYGGSVSNLLKSDDLFTNRPFEAWSYSNIGYDLVGAAVEKKSGELFQDYTAETIFEPMRIDASWDGSYISDSDLIASCYRTNGQKSMTNAHMTEGLERLDTGENYIYMAGGLIISAVDLARLFTVLTNDGMYGNRRILSGEAVEEMQTVQDIATGNKFRQCLGLRYAENCYDGRNMYFHPGNAYGVLSLAAYDESDRSGVVVITNGAKIRRDNYSNYTVCSDMLSYIYKNIITK